MGFPLAAEDEDSKLTKTNNINFSALFSTSLLTGRTARYTSEHSQQTLPNGNWLVHQQWDIYN